MTLRKPLNQAITTALIAGGLTFGGAAMAQPQGLYSADELMDAEVFSKESDTESIGEVEDILLDESMQLHSVVIETGGVFDFGEKQYVIDAGNFAVETSNGDSLENIQYWVLVNMTEEQISQQPEYTNDWWNQTKQTTRQAWENTKETASSAWESTKAFTSDMLEDASNALDEAGDEADQAVQNDQQQ
ncbi:PRC-barrel domain protein [Modicisalibacter xianhensis]|uniref:PRC-barrel domain protein n=1 Tax=Modicisalibacter xianhensis TaxID=442341 RepID=A0A4V6QAP9_9GAMM|nr:PRC-barrel domain-containing protein [Halomonas xianhensis]TDX26053.1 PRC-barrel domain protein [Halomonas xianhensis]